MATRKTPTTAGKPRAVEKVPSSAGERRPRLVAMSRQRKASPEAPDGSILPDEIRVRAYFLSLERGELPTDPIGDWLRAESELTAGRRRANTRG